MTAPEIPTATESDVFITRAFAAPRDVVWRFWTQPELLGRWFGPAGVHVGDGTVDIDLRPGGRWNLDMVDDASGQAFPLRVVLAVVEEPEYLEGVVSADAADGTISEVRLRVWFHDHGDVTRMTLHQGPFSPQFREQTAEGWLSSFEGLDSLLASR